MDTAEFFSLWLNFSDDLAESFFQELATLPTFLGVGREIPLPTGCR
jgi:hypothetical protein